MGSKGSNLSVIHPVEPARVEGHPIAAMPDHKPIVNIKSFGQCKSLANPIVAAATAASNGKLQPMPCIPNTTVPWIGAKMSVRIKGNPAILDNSKLTCMWAGIIEVTNPGQKTMKEGGTPLNYYEELIKSEEKAKDVAVAAGNTAERVEKEEIKELTVKDFVEILEKIEAKQGYEAARHYASNDIDYWKINALAMKYVKETDEEKKEKEKDNDPNLMPSRFMLLYGADDDELRKQGNIDDHPDNFEDQPEHKICVEMLRKGLILLGYNIEEKGPFDDLVYHAFLQYHWQHGRVKWDNVYECDDDHEKPLDRIADKYGVFTWKYFEEEHEGEVDHDRIIEALSPEYGDELLAEKGADPQRYKPGVAYHYVWVPFHVTVELGETVGDKS